MNYSPRFGVTVLATTLGFAALSTFAPTTAQAQTTLLSQGFEDVTTLAGLGYAGQNNSTSAAAGTIGGYYQGNSTNFSAQAGTATSYLANDYQDTSSTATSGATISDFFITPTLSLQNGDTISFYTRTLTGSTFPDRLELRLSTAGTSTNVGTTTTSVGDFTTLLLTVNPGLAVGPANYPETFTQFSATLTGIAPGTTGRYAFRYFVINAGTNGANSNFIGIDTLSVVRPAATAAPEPGTLAMVALGMVGGVAVRRRRK